MADRRDCAAGDDVEVLEVVGGTDARPPPQKKVRRIPEQVAAAACPVFEASAADLLNFDAIIHHLWHEKQAWRSGIAKVILTPCALKAIHGGGDELPVMKWDDEDPKCFWANFCKVPITRVSKQLVTKEDSGLYIVERTNELVSDGVLTVAGFVERASSLGLVHPWPETKPLQQELPTTFGTTDNRPSRLCEEDLLIEGRSEFWRGLDKLGVGESTPEMEYVTELNMEPVPESELHERLQAPGPKRNEVRTFFVLKVISAC